MTETTSSPKAIETIEALRKVIYRETLTTNARLGYDRTIDLVGLLADKIHDYEGDNEDWLYLGEFDVTPDSIMVGAYWHLTEWHRGQESASYRAMCQIGQVFSPGMSDGPEPDSSEMDFYQALNEMAEKTEKAFSSQPLSPGHHSPARP